MTETGNGEAGIEICPGHVVISKAYIILSLMDGKRDIVTDKFEERKLLRSE
jgi:hypothetical protein